MESGDGEQETRSEVEELRQRVEALKRELGECRAELARLQKQLGQAQRLQTSTEGYNQDLRRQVDKLSAEIHEWKKKNKDKVDSKTQTEEYVWTESDYYNYYYGGYSENPEATEAAKDPNVEMVEAADAACTNEAPEANESNETSNETSNEASNEASNVASKVASNESAATEVTVPAENDVVATTEEGDGSSIADMLRATAEEAMTQTGFVFDETTGMYYDHSTGFYYDSVSQLYYDSNTGFYYYYDAESGRYQFHSKIEVPAAVEDAGENKGRKIKKWVKKSSNDDSKESKFDELRMKDEVTDSLDQRMSKRNSESRKLKRRSSSPDVSSRRKESKHRREKSSKRKKEKNGSHGDDRGRTRKKSKKSKSKKKKKKRSSSRSNDSEGNSEPEEGEITESEKESTHSFSSLSSSPFKECQETEMEIQNPEAKSIWPPCVRVMVVRSPVLQVGTLFIITADCSATFGREKDMDHAVRIPEMGVSKFHAEVYFDQEQQSYMLVDQGSQNGTVINGNRILQPKTKCEPHALMHGDEVKMGDTVLSFHIHSGTDTCDGCEPGQVMAHLSKHKTEEKPGPVLTKEDKETLRQKELKQMKAKYGLQSNEYEETKALKNPKYKNRAESRRQTVGSQGAFQRDDAPASVHEEISQVNKGRKMLEKMGWKKGEGLGKEGTGMKDPIELKIRTSQSGLGSGATLSVDSMSLTKSKSQKNWEKARERFADVFQPDAPAPNASPKAWVRADGTDAQAELDSEGLSVTSVFIGNAQD